MSLGRKGRKTGAGGLRASALVVQADGPLDKLDSTVRWGKLGRGTVRILVDAEGAPLYVSRGFKLVRDRWLVRGMEIPVAIDPSNPDDFEIEWEAIPSIEERVAANDPTLADPAGTRRRVVEAMRSAGLMGPNVDEIPGGMGQLAARSQEARAEATPERFAEALERAASEPAPPGKARAVVMLVTTMATIVQEGASADGSGGHNVRSSSGRHDAVLAVNVPGRDPYAVLVRRFKRPSGRASITGAGLPALVSSTDPNDVEVLWDELPSIESQLGQRIADGMQGAAAGMREESEISEQMTDALQNAGKDPGATAAAPKGDAIPQLSGDMRGLMVENAKRALQFVQDPKMRKMMIEQYRAAGIEIDESEEGP